MELCFKVGDSVEWIGVTNKGAKIKRVGVVEAIVEAGQMPLQYKHLLYQRQGNTRPVLSYVVRVRKGYDGVYWPPVHVPRHTTRAVAIAAKKQAHRICGNESCHEHPYYCTLSHGHKGPHIATICGHPVMQWRGKETP